MTDIVEDQDIYDPTQVEYVESERPYQAVMTADEIKLLMEYQEYEQLLEEGISEKDKGELKQLKAAYLIREKELWKYAVSQVSQRRFRSQEEWIQEEVVAHPGISAFSRTNFFDKVRIINAAVNAGKRLEEALRVGINHTAIEEAELAGALKITATKQNKRTQYVLTATEIGTDKLLNGGLKTVPEFLGDVANMTSREALKTIRHDIGRAYGYYSAVIQYAGVTPLFDEDKAHVFAVEYTFVDPNNGSTPYQMKILIEGDMDKPKREMALRVLKGDFRL
jgi:hypothetical protein